MSTRDVRRRGQLLPMWSMSLVTSFALIFFVQNFANQIRWTIRAQNAADTAAAATMLPDADLANQSTTILYTLALDEVRIRYLNQAALNVLAGYGCSTYTNCRQDYAAIYQALTNAISVYDPGSKGVNLPFLDVHQSATNGDETAAYNHIVKQGCNNTPTIGDCTNGQETFNYHTLGSDGNGHGNGKGKGNNGSNIDVYACATVSTALPQLLGLSSSSSFKAIGRSTMGLVAHSETFSPGTTQNPNSGTVYAPNEYAAGLADQNAYTKTDFTTTSITVYFYSPGPVQPTTSFTPSSASC